jgi:Right handed beta helix region
VSFRAAIALANGDRSIRQVQFDEGLGSISLTAPVVYSGGQGLEIVGNGAELDGSGLAASASGAFLANGGGDLLVHELAVSDAPNQGITYQVPAGSMGVKKVSLVEVQIANNGGHGVLVNDQDNPDVVEGEPPDPAGSDASLDVTVTDSVFEDNGFSALDRDGLRVNEGAGGFLRAIISGTDVVGNGGDGIELDERGNGDASLSVSRTQVSENGFFDIVTDPDDGMDVDESGPGHLDGTVSDSAAVDNAEEGFDLNENDEGNLIVDMTDAEAVGNGEEGIDLEEDDDFAGGGSLTTRLTGITANGNGSLGDTDAGIKVREKGDGNLAASVRDAEANDNLNETSGIQIREDDAGNLTATVDRSTTNDNDNRGVDFDENGDGNLTATARHGTSSENADAGIRADQGGDGTGTLTVLFMTLTGNDEEIDDGGVTVNRPQ